jgi:hypothetical protein
MCFKIFPKALSSGFDLVINKIILPCENDFIKTRDIMDGFSLCMKFCMNQIITRKKGRPLRLILRNLMIR